MVKNEARLEYLFGNFKMNFACLNYLIKTGANTIIQASVRKLCVSNYR